MPTEDAPEPGEGVDELKQLLVERFFLGLVRQFRGEYPNLGSAAIEDAIATAVEKVLKRLAGGSVRDVRGYLAKVAHNEAKKAGRRAAREIPLGERPDGLDEAAEDTVLREAALGIIKAEIAGWENAHVREVMLVYVDVIALDEPLETDEVAEIVGANLGEEINPLSVRTWKARGIKRLRTFIEDMYGGTAPHDETEG
jgi:DNA-directed RNA polymerase specialized sigma24 family protein